MDSIIRPRSNLAFVTLGMLIIDEIEYHDGRPNVTNILGGAGTYAALGARMAAGLTNARLVSWIVDMGGDFPPEMKDFISRWRTSCVFRTDPLRVTTRAWNGYGPGQKRAFRYLTPKLRIDVSDLNDEQVMADSFHMVCSPARCIEICDQIFIRRDQLNRLHPAATTVWEPVPDLCNPSQLPNLREAVKSCSLVSPNGEELSQFFQNHRPKMSRQQMVESVMSGVTDRAWAVVVREGSYGSYLYMPRFELHFPAYHQDIQAVIDPTGAGNTFLGALAIAAPGTGGRVFPTVQDFERHFNAISERMDPRMRGLVSAMVHATVAASFAIEQVGLPRIGSEIVSHLTDDCNGENYFLRWGKYMERHWNYLVNQLSTMRLTN